MTFQNRPEAFRSGGPSEIERRQQDRSELSIKALFRERLTEILLVIPALGTTMLTFYGISVTMEETGATIVQKGQALAFSITIGIFAWLGWFYLFGLIYRLSGRRLAAALSAATVYVGTLAAIDAPFNMLALAGGAAVQMSLADTAATYETKKEVVFTGSTVAQRLVPAISAQAQRFHVLEDNEIKYGTYSGRKGPGKVSSAFGQIATLLDALVRDLQQGLTDAKSVQQEVAVRSAELKAQTFRQGPIRARVEAATVAADRMDDLLARLGQYDYSASISATLLSLENIFPAPTASGSSFETTQNTEVAAIAAMAKPVAAALREGLVALQALPAADTARKRPLNAHDAIRTYWRPLFAEWCAAFFIDIAPAALLIILIAAWRERDRLRPPDEPPSISSPSSNPENPNKGIQS